MIGQNIGLRYLIPWRWIDSRETCSLVVISIVVIAGRVVLRAE
jgi:hypothetical protein